MTLIIEEKKPHLDLNSSSNNKFCFDIVTIIFVIIILFLLFSAFSSAPDKIKQEQKIEQTQSQYHCEYENNRIKETNNPK